MRRLFITVVFLAITLPGTASIHLELSPYLWLDSAGEQKEIDSPSLRELYDWYQRPPLANLILDIQFSGLTLFSQVELRTDLMADLRYFTWWNLPGFANGNLYVDSRFPQTAYIEYVNSWLTFSLGRRKLHWGPGSIGVAIGRTTPYFDHLWFEVHPPRSRIGQWEYNFLVITNDTRASETGDRSVEDSKGTTTDSFYNGLYKTLVSHRFSYQWERVRVSLSDYSLIYGRVPDLQELAPLLHYHSFFQKGQNVMMGLSVDYLPLSWLRVFGEYLQDEILSAQEIAGKDPTAMGFAAGAQLVLVEGSIGEKTATLLTTSEDRLLQEPSFELDGELVLTVEGVYTSRYLYNRASELGKITNPMFYMWEYKPVKLTGFYGAPYGPGTMTCRVDLDYNTERISAEMIAEYLLSGDGGIDTPYPPDSIEGWFLPAQPLSHSFRLQLSGEWRYMENQGVFGSLTVDYADGFRIQGGIGWGMRLF